MAYSWDNLTWDSFIKGYVPSKSNLTILWQWLAAWKPLKLGSHISWRGLCVICRICYSRYLKLFVVPKHFIFHATEKNLKIELAEFQHKSANKFSQKEFGSIKMETIFEVSFFKLIAWSINFEYIFLILLCLSVSTTQLRPFLQNCLVRVNYPPLS